VARDQLSTLLPVIEQVLGPGHPLTTATRRGLARLGTRTETAVQDTDDQGA
jgi:hypothetical protein